MREFSFSKLIIPVTCLIFSSAYATAAEPLFKIPEINAEFVKIKAGTFEMFGPHRKPSQPPHIVTISEDFEIQTTEVTQEQWLVLMGSNPSEFQEYWQCRQHDKRYFGVKYCKGHPVESVSWDDVQGYITKLNENNDHYNYRLPTEAEWEYAARGGSTTGYSFCGDKRLEDKSLKCESLLGDYAWYGKNSENKTHPVGQKWPNAYGLYDVHGNVAEWVDGLYHETGRLDPNGSQRILRGHAWSTWMEYDFSFASRWMGSGLEHNNVSGFRLVRTPKVKN